jgi:GAF domain
MCSVFVVTSTARQGVQIDDLVGDPLERRELGREAAASRLLRALLQPFAAQIPDHYELRLFLPDDDGMLVAEYESAGSAPSEVWKPGRGATGMAWLTNGMVIVRGTAVSDATYGLDEEQQDRYKSVQVVAANPVQNARGRRLGVLVASSEQDDAYFDRPDARLNLLALSEVVARVLVDIVRLDRD